MGWEERGGRRYYYRARKVGGRVVKEYVGSGPMAELVASQDAAARAERAAVAARLRAERERVAPAEADLAAIEEVAEALARVSLVAAGYRRHKRGEWRKRRGTDQAT